jgi:hypothetical protein
MEMDFCVVFCDFELVQNLMIVNANLSSARCNIQSTQGVVNPIGQPLPTLVQLLFSFDTGIVQYHMRAYF